MARRKLRPARNQSTLFGGDDGQSRDESVGSPGNVGNIRSSGGSPGPLRDPAVGDISGRALSGPDMPDGPGPGVSPADDTPGIVQSGEIRDRRSGDPGGVDLSRPAAHSFSPSKPPAGIDGSNKIVYLNGYGKISLNRLRELRESGIEIDYWCIDSGFGYEIPVDMALCYFDHRFRVPVEDDPSDWL
jgi:hypothetical protein